MIEGRGEKSLLNAPGSDYRLPVGREKEKGKMQRYWTGQATKKKNESRLPCRNAKDMLRRRAPQKAATESSRPHENRNTKTTGKTLLTAFLLCVLPAFGSTLRELQTKNGKLHEYPYAYSPGRHDAIEEAHKRVRANHSLLRLLKKNTEIWFSNVSCKNRA